MRSRITFIKNAVRYLDTNKDSIVKDIFRIPTYNDEPKTYSYFAHIKDSSVNEYHEDSVASGTSFSEERALAKLFGEIVERYTITKQPKNTLKNSYENLIKKGLNALNPDTCNPYDPIIFKTLNPNTKDIKKTVLHWVEGKDINTHQPIWIPAQIVFLPFNKGTHEPFLELPISTGAACGKTLKDAVYRGVCEIIERDSYMLYYLLKQPGEIINLQSSKLGIISSIDGYLKKYHLKLFIINLTTDLDIPSVAAIITDKTNLGPSVSVGLKAGFDVEETIIGAIEESLMVRTWIREKFIYIDPNFKIKKHIKTAEERAFYWFNVSAIKKLDFWLKSKNMINFDVFKKRIKMKNKDNYSQLSSSLSTKKISAYYIDLSTIEMKKNNLYVAKTIIPFLQPMHLDERYPYLGKERLLKTSIKWKKDLKTHKINSTPHPFL